MKYILTSRQIFVLFLSIYVDVHTSVWNCHGCKVKNRTVRLDTINSSKVLNIMINKLCLDVKVSVINDNVANKLLHTCTCSDFMET